MFVIIIASHLSHEYFEISVALMSGLGPSRGILSHWTSAPYESFLKAFLMSVFCVLKANLSS